MISCIIVTRSDENAMDNKIDRTKPCSPHDVPHAFKRTLEGEKERPRGQLQEKKQGSRGERDGRSEGQLKNEDRRPAAASARGGPRRAAAPSSSAPRSSRRARATAGPGGRGAESWRQGRESRRDGRTPACGDPRAKRWAFELSLDSRHEPTRKRWCDSRLRFWVSTSSSILSRSDQDRRPARVLL